MHMIFLLYCLCKVHDHQMGTEGTSLYEQITAYSKRSLVEVLTVSSSPVFGVIRVSYHSSPKVKTVLMRGGKREEGASAIRLCSFLPQWM